MKSKTELFRFLSERFKQKVELKNVDNETYGKQSFIYLFHVDKRWNITRQQLERELQDAGFKVMKKYSPGQPHLEIQVSYFKGWHWDE